MILSIKEAIELYSKNCYAKCKAPFANIFIKSMFAGMMIGLGAAGSSVAAHAITNVGIARFVAGLVFPVGLMMVILLGAELFTGDCLMVVGIPDGNISGFQFAKMLVIVWIGNLVGGVIFAALTMMSGQFDYSGGLLGAYTIKVALAKATISPERAITSGILCNVLVCAAVLMALCAKDVAGKLFVCFFVIMLFVTSGFEHCVANMYYIFAGVLAKTNPDYIKVATEQYGISLEALGELNLTSMFVKNLLPVTIGNIIGGACFMGLPLYYLNRNKNESKKIKEVATNDECNNGNSRSVAC